MPRVALTLGTTPSRGSITTDLLRTGLRRSLINPSRPMRGEIITSLALAGRLRSTHGGLNPVIKTRSGAVVKARIKASMIPALCQISGSVEAFLSAIPTPAPRGRLLIHTLDEVSNPAAAPRSFGGSFLRGETIPLKFQIRGQRLTGLSPIFTCCLGGGSVGFQIEKRSPEIRKTETITDTRTQIEVAGFSFSIESADTLALPATGETELEWLLVLADGLGRQYPIDSGKFKIYNHC